LFIDDQVKAKACTRLSRPRAASCNA